MKKRRIIAAGAAGLIGGLAASAVMNIFQRRISKMLGGEERSHGAQSRQIGTPDHGAGAYLTKIGADSPADDAAERTANIVSVGVSGHQLTDAEKDTGGTIFHYVFGATSGLAYGLASEFLPIARSGWGLPFGAVVWIVADETIVPALGLSKHARKYSSATIAYALAAHLVYGLITEGSMKLLHPATNGKR